MKILLSIGLLFSSLPQLLLGGDWGVGITGSPAITVPNTSLTAPSPTTRFTYSLGVSALYDLTPRFSAKGGFQYSRKEILLAKDIPDTRNSFDPATGRIDMSRIVVGDASEVYESVMIPVSVHYKVVRSETIDLILAGGVEAGYLFQRRSIVEPTTTGTWSHSRTEHELLTAVTMGIGVRCALSADFTLLLVPTYSYSHYPHQDFGSLNFHTVALEGTVLCLL